MYCLYATTVPPIPLCFLIKGEIEIINSKATFEYERFVILLDVQGWLRNKKKILEILMVI